MQPFKPNDNNKIGKVPRRRKPIRDRRLAKQLDSQCPPRFVLRTTKKRSIAGRNPALAHKISQMRLTIAPIIHVKTGLPAPDFPHTMLSLFTLTEAQLDALAIYYSQSDAADELKYQYPQVMDWSQPFLEHGDELSEDCKLTDIERIKVKMRMFARFIGMRGADTPVWEYERQMEILGNKVSRLVREEKELLARSKGFRGLGRY